MEKADDKVGRALTGALDDVGEHSRMGIMELMADGAMLASGGPTAVMMRRMMAPSVRSMQNMIYGTLSKMPPVKFAMSASLHAGRPSLTKLTRIGEGGAFAPTPTSFDKYVNAGRTIAKAMKVPPVSMITANEFKDIEREMGEASPDKLGLALSMGMASKGIPQEAVAPMVRQHMAISQYLQQSMPRTHGSKWVGEEKETGTVSQQELLKFSKRMRASYIPVSVLSDFLSQDLSREAAEAWWAVYPEWADWYADRISKTVDVATAYGRQFNPKEKQQIGLMVDSSGQKLGRTRSASLVKSLQMAYSTEEDATPGPQPGGPPAPGTPKAVSGWNNNNISPSQGLTNRLTSR
jgi:hypothetical protein